MRLIGKVVVASAAAVGLFLAAPPQARATPFANSDSKVTNEAVDSSGTVEDYQPTNPASSVTLNSTNYAESQLDPSTYTGGAAVGASVGGSSTTTTNIGNDWFLNCSPTSVCSVLPVSSSLPIAITIALSGTMSQSNDFSAGNYSYIDYSVQYSLGNGGRFSFEINQDDDAPYTTATYEDASGHITDLAVALSLADGVYSFSVDDTIDDEVECSVESPCVPVVCDTCGGAPLFTDLGQISAEVDSYVGPPGFVDGLDPFSVNVVSLDPDYTLSNDAPSPSTVPEPDSAVLLSFALAGLVLMRRRHPQ